MRAGRGITLLATLATFAVMAAVPTQTRAAAGCADDSKYPGGVNPGGDWRAYGHDQANTRTQPAEHTIGRLQAPKLAPAWTFSSTQAGGSGDFTGTPTVADGCLFVGSNDGWVFAMNADTGALVWKQHVPAGGGINSSITVPGDGRVYAAVSHAASHAQGGQCTGEQCVGPYVIALDQASGTLVWQSRWTQGTATTNVIDTQPGSDVYGSPTVLDGIIFEGVSGGAAELGDEADRYAFQGSFVILDALTGDVIKKTWTIHPPKQPNDNYAGGGIWSTPAVDPNTKMLYVGTANPFKPEAQHPNTDAVIKVDLDRTHATFGEIVGRFNGTVDQYLPQMEQLPCVDTPGNPPPYYPQGLGSCMDEDYDFGASPNLFTDTSGAQMVGAGQKSGVYFAFHADTMKQAWKTIVGPPSSAGGIVGSTAFDGSSIYGPITLAGYVWSLHASNGTPKWVSPVADGAHWGEPVSVANGIAYTVDLKGFLDAYDAPTGAPLLHRPIAIGSATGGNPVLSWGGVSIARNMVYTAVGITALSNGFVVAFKVGGGETGGGGLPPLPNVGAGATAVAGPGSYTTTYWTPIVVVRAGSEKLSFTNLDLQRHNIVEVTNGTAPIFESDLAALGETVPVRFHAHLERGKVYSFYCTLHPGMFGRVVAA
jgi:polyvinyl alcohol dehydrogenase (cytochrome)